MHGRPPHLPGSRVTRSRRDWLTRALYRRNPNTRRAAHQACWIAQDAEEFAVAADAFRHAPTWVPRSTCRRARYTADSSDKRLSSRAMRARWRAICRRVFASSSARPRSPPRAYCARISSSRTSKCALSSRAPNKHQSERPQPRALKPRGNLPTLGMTQRRMSPADEHHSERPQPRALKSRGAGGEGHDALLAVRNLGVAHRSGRSRQKKEEG